jgi:8-oxo-dGTP pyrophosphatase MutT (NUDIX family)
MTVPKGGIEEGETSGQAAVRESFEEGKQLRKL